MASHDANKTVGDLRDHLARHDKPIAFLFGAGTSCSVKAIRPDGATSDEPLIPAVAGLTQICATEVRGLGENYEQAWPKVEAQCANNGAVPNVEAILSRLRMMLGAMGTEDKLLGLDHSGIAKFEETVRRTIAKVSNPDRTRIPEETPHRLMARWIARMSRKYPVEIFTLNYDVLIEMAFEAERIPLFDGFVGSHRPFFLPDSLRRAETAPGSNWVRLWKMHGSVTWRRENYDGRARIVRGESDESGEMILPSFHKYDESRQQPYAAIIDRLARFLDQDDALLITSGFMGSTLSRYQADLLATHFDRVVLMLDGDEAGRQGAMNIAQTLGARMSVAAVSLEDGCQPDQLAPAVIQQVVGGGGAESNSGGP